MAIGGYYETETHLIISPLMPHPTDAKKLNSKIRPRIFDFRRVVSPEN
jgi:hypothetical protein